jgi:3-hydroxy-9,10-secoandrosta-1,3,5(10)-triene-9,17-dione monooxygenase reductase component
MGSQQAFEAGEFRKALGSFTTGVTVVTTRGTENNDIGLTANSFNSVSIEPPMILWSLGKNALSMPQFRAAQYFAVHILSEDQEAISGQFAKRGVDKFAGVEIERGPNDVPLLKHCAARFVCKTAHQYEGGDHIIFVGEVIEFTHWERLPLLFHGGQYSQLLKTSAAVSGKRSGELMEESLGYLLRVASRQMLRPLKLALEAQGLTFAQYYFLAALAKYGHGSKERFLDLLAKGETVCTHAEVDALLQRGLAANNADVWQLTDAGTQLHVELVSIYKASESTVLEGLDFEMHQMLHIALLKLIETTKIDD